jgi:predicted Zn finger-like uncharacterized protein
MIIRCPHCEHTRSISESKIPSTAELATCPKCKHRFRFRTLAIAAQDTEQKPAPQDAPANEQRSPGQRPAASPPGSEIIRPQQAFRESAEQRDIWDAVDELHQRWEAQLDQHVVDVSLDPSLTEEDAAHSPDAPEASLPEDFFPPASLPEASLRAASPAPSEQAPAPSEQEQPGTEEARESLSPVTSVNEEKTAPDSLDGRAGPEQIPAAPRFLYAENGPDPEERVEHDLLMLRDDNSGRPMRDLGRLKEFPADAEGEKAESLQLADFPPEQEAVENIPWEQGGGAGRLKAFFATVRGAMFGGPAFFAGLTGAGSLAPGYLFFLLMGYAGALSTWGWFAAARTLIPDLAAFAPPPVAVPALLLLGPVILGLMLLFATGWVRLSLRLLAPDKADFGKIFKLVSYSAAPLVLCVVPFAGPLLGAVWSFAALAMGCRGALGLSRALSVCVPVPPVALILAAIAWCFI